MHRIEVLLTLLMTVAFHFSIASGAEIMRPDDEVRVNGRVAVFGSVVSFCDGDSVEAVGMSEPLKISGNYLPLWRHRIETAFNLAGLRWAAPAVAVLLLAFLIAGVPQWRIYAMAAALSLLCEFSVRCMLAERFCLVGKSDMLLAVGMGISFLTPFLKNRIMAIYGTVPVAVLGIWGAFEMQHPAIRPFYNMLDSGWLPLHVGLMTVAYACFLLSAVVCCITVGMRHVRNIVAVGEGFLIAGIGAGSAWASVAWGNWWSWDPKEIFALASAIVYGVILVFWKPLSKRVELLRATVASAALLILLTWFGISRFGGNHTYGNISQNLTYISSNQTYIEYEKTWNPLCAGIGECRRCLHSLDIG